MLPHILFTNIYGGTFRQTEIDNLIKKGIVRTENRRTKHGASYFSLHESIKLMVIARINEHGIDVFNNLYLRKQVWSLVDELKVENFWNHCLKICEEKNK